MKNRFLDKKLATIAQALIDLANNDTVRSEMHDLDQDVANLNAVMDKGDPWAYEQAMVNLYTRLHSFGATYSLSEKEILHMRKGYSCYPGGFSPLIRAEPFIKPESIVADLGAGNGLQGLLLQHLYPHRKTMQIELSSEMIRVGQIFQKALEISNDRVEWIHNDITNISIEAVDFIYIYRPARPFDSGREIYQAIARKLAARHKPLVVFSVADCLAPFLDQHFSVFFTDGHLTCFRNV